MSEVGERGAGRGGLVASAAIALLVTGIGLGFLVARAGGEPGVQPNAPGVQLPPSAPPPTLSPSPAGTAPVTVEAPSEAGAAIEAFLRAEREGDLQTSFNLLAPADRERFGPFPVWRNLHADLPVLRAFTVEQVRSSGDDRARAVTTLRLRPQLDEFAGLVPGAARAEWPLRRTDQGWTVLFNERTLTPVFPPADQAAGDTQAWVRARQACEPAGLEGGVYGRTDLADALCDAPGQPQVGRPGPLQPGPETTELTAAFGEDVFGWSRVVPVREPVPLRAVLAPLGERWEVIGVLPPR